MDEASRDELDRRLALLESPEGGMVQADLPRFDILAAVGAIVIVSALLLWVAA